MENLTIIFKILLSFSCAYAVFHVPMSPMMPPPVVPQFWHKAMIAGPPVGVGAPLIHPNVQEAMLNHHMHMKQKMHLQKKMHLQQKMDMKNNILIKKMMKHTIKPVFPVLMTKPVLHPAMFKKPKPVFKPKVPMVIPNVKYLIKKVKYVKHPKIPTVWSNVAYQRRPERPESSLPVPVFRRNVFTGYRLPSPSQRVDLPYVRTRRPPNYYRPPVMPTPYQPAPAQPAMQETSSEAVQQKPITPSRPMQWSQVAHGAYNFNDDDDDDDDDFDDDDYYDDDDRFEDYWEDRFDDWKDRVEDRLTKNSWRYYDDDDDNRFDDFDRKDYVRRLGNPGGSMSIQHTVSQGVQPIVSSKYLEEKLERNRKYEENIAELERKRSLPKVNVQIQQTNNLQGTRGSTQIFDRNTRRQIFIPTYDKQRLSSYVGDSSGNVQSNDFIRAGQQTVYPMDRNPGEHVYVKQTNSFDNNSDLQVEHSVTFNNMNKKYFDKFDDKKRNYMENFAENNQSQLRNVGINNTVSRRFHIPRTQEFITK